MSMCLKNRCDRVEIGLTYEIKCGTTVYDMRKYSEEKSGR